MECGHGHAGTEGTEGFRACFPVKGVVHGADGVHAGCTTCRLGLMSTMGTNVMERIRKIGIIQAINASMGVVQRIFIYEGMVIGVLRWIIVILLALPLGIVIGNISGKVLIDAPLDFSFSLTGIILWLAIVVVFSATASFHSTWKASRLMVNVVLAYE